MQKEPELIRSATKKDADQIFNLLGELNSGKFDIQRFQSIYKKDLNNPDVFYLVATDNGKLVGYICGSVEDRLGHDKKVATVRGLVVSSGHRGHGIGIKLFQAFEEITKKNSCEKIEVFSKIEREDAHRFYIDKAGMAKTHYRFSKEI